MTPPAAPSPSDRLRAHCAEAIGFAKRDPAIAVAVAASQAAEWVSDDVMPQADAEAILQEALSGLALAGSSILATFREYLESCLANAKTRRQLIRERGAAEATNNVIDLRPPPEGVRPSARGGAAGAKRPKPAVVEPVDFNATYALVSTGSSVLVMRELIGPDGRPQMHFMSADAFKLLTANMKVAVGDRAVSAGKLWLESPDRRQYDGICFRPAADAPKGYLNLWKGFSAVPNAKGSCAIFKDHLLTNCCRGDPDLFEWVWGWLAHLFQHPGDKPGTALVFRGGQGVGKSTVGEVIGSLIEDHYLLVDDPRYVTGNFNAHLERTILLQVDEGFWAGDKTAEGRLKGLVTARRQMIERKGVDPIPVENHCRLLLTSNESWVVPAGMGERRFCVLEVGDLCRENHGYFAAMRAELDNGGRERLLFELLNTDLERLDLRSIPSTAALSDQVEASLDDAGRWWLEKLTDGEFSRSHGWPIEIPADDFFKSFTHWCDQLGVRRRYERARLVKRIQTLGTTLIRIRPRDEHGNRFYAYEMPDLERCRAALRATAPHLRPEWDSGPEGG